MNSEDVRRAGTTGDGGLDRDWWGVLLSGGGLGLIFTVIPVALCDYSGHGVFIADKRLELLSIGILVGVCAGGVRLWWSARGHRRGGVST